MRAAHRGNIIGVTRCSEPVVHRCADTTPLDRRFAWPVMTRDEEQKPVTPGDQLIFELTMIRKRGKTFVMQGEAKVEGQLVAEAEFMAAIVDKDAKA